MLVRGMAHQRPGPPYPLPTAAPYNAPTYAITPTPDGTGSTVHPSVVDFSEKWNGYRYWMGVTPYFGSTNKVEDPCVLASNDGHRWHVPPGLTNPIEPTPAGTAYHSDTDLTYDPDTGDLVLIWRETDDYHDPDAAYSKLYLSRSADGTTWSAKTTIIHLTGQATGTLFSPALVRVAAGDWRLFTGWGAGGETWTATSPDGPWSGPTQFIWTGDAHAIWHLDVNYDGSRFYLLGAAQPGADWHLFPGVSEDGISWTFGPTFLQNRPGEWDSKTMYRATMTPHEDGLHWRLWYSSDGPGSWHVALTQVPRSLWEDLI